MRVGMVSTEWVRKADGSWGGGGCLWYRLALPAKWLRAAGHEVRLGRLIAHKETHEFGVAEMGATEAHLGFDLIVMQRYMEEGLAPRIRAARERGQIIINDVDDWFEGLPQSNRAYANTDPRNSSTSNREHYRQIIASSSAITVSTPYLAERYAKLGIPVHVLPNAIDIERWAPYRVRPVSENLIIGWLGAIPYRSLEDFGVLRGVLSGWMERNPTAKFLHVGAFKFDELFEISNLLGLDASRVEQRMGAPIEELPGLYRGIDIGLAPVHGSPFGLAKSYLKSLEYSAAGVPSIASKLPEYRMLGASLLADKPVQWTQHLDRLADPNERAKVAAAARTRAEKFSIEKMGHQWEDAYTKAMLVDRVRRSRKMVTT